MIATGSESESKMLFGAGAPVASPAAAAAGAVSRAGGAPKISSNREMGGASGQFCSTASRNDASEQQIVAGVQSFIMATSSTGDWRAYSGTTILPSVMSARSRAAQRILLGASSTQRSPL